MNDTNKDLDHRTLVICANYESASTIETIVQTLAKSNGVDTRSADTYLQMLREWSQALPDELRNVPYSNGTDDYQERVIGNIHVSCTYYFGVIIVTRQFLIMRTMKHLRSSRESRFYQAADEENYANEVDQEKVASFSDACTRSAELMVQLCYEAHTNNILLGNMCLLK